MNFPELNLPTTMVPEFYYIAPDNSLMGYGIQKGDHICFDRKPDPAHFVIGAWDDLCHVCVEGPDGTLFNAADHKEAPQGAYRAGRVLFIERRWIMEAAV